MRRKKKKAKTTNRKLSSNIFKELLIIYQEPYSSIFNSTILYFISNLLGKIGDTSLACLSKSSTGHINSDLLESFLLQDTDERVSIILNKELVQRVGQDPHDFFSFNRALAFYRLAAIYYKKAQREYSHAFQYKKLLYLIKDYLIFFKDSPEKVQTVLDFCLKLDSQKEQIQIESIATKVFLSISKTSNIANRPQMEKYHEIFNHDTLYDAEKDIYNNIYVNVSTAPEIREVILVVEEIRLKLHRLTSRKQDKLIIPSHIKSELQPRPILSYTDQVSNMFCRMLELKYRSEYNWWRLSEMVKEFISNDEELDVNPKTFLENASRKHFKIYNKSSHYFRFFQDHLTNSGQPDLQQLIVDSIFCLWETSRIFKNYEISYITNYSFQANTYFKLGNWIELYRKCIWVQKNPIAGKEKSDNLERALYNLIGRSASSQMDQYFFYELAIQAYEKAVQMHRQGKAYKDINSNMHFLEDDYNDNLTHFNAATERFRINIGVIHKKIETLSKSMEERSKVYQYSSYFSNEVA